jgi:hypothetical protein
MSVITVPTSRFLGQPLTEEDSQSHAFICEVGNVIASIEDGLEYSLGQLACDFEIDEGDYIREKSARQELLRQAASFLLQRPVAGREVVRENLLTFDAVNTFFYDYKSNPPANYSPQGEKPTVKTLQVVNPKEYTKSPTFRAAMCRLVQKVSQTIDQEITEVFQPDAASEPQWNTARTLMLKGLTGFIAQVGYFEGDVMISERQFDYKNAAEYFGLPADEAIVQPAPSAEVEALRRENNRLKLEVETLRRQKARAEEKAISALRYRPSSRGQRSFTSLDEYIENMMSDAVAEGVRQVLAEGKANV